MFGYGLINRNSNERFFMQKSGFTVIEVVVVFLLILAVTCLVLPRSMNSTKQARLISKWTETFSEMQYTFSAIKAQSDVTANAKFKKAQNNDDRAKIVVETIKPYLRIKSDIKTDEYKQYYMDNRIVDPEDKYYFNDFYLTEINSIVGLKWFTKKCGKKDVCGVINIDVNGISPPNIWGRDVFGINIFDDRIEPLGKDIEVDVLRNDCSRWGQGLYCSYYYLIGGRFD